ncbi:hypothetical protein [Streptomyces sp. NPDC013455]|uniref:hypothetical protein n=1 Tax=Streptomyces sp. NPDC013455 TaxID=3155605 RepID=UPI0033D33BDB
MSIRRNIVMSVTAAALAVGGLAAGTTASAQPRVSAAPSDCPKGYFCGYKQANYKKLAFRYKDCYMQEIPDGLNSGGSWYNNQTKDTTTGMYGKNKQWIYTTPGAPYGDPHGDWAPVWYVWNYC